MCTISQHLRGSSCCGGVFFLGGEGGENITLEIFKFHEKFQSQSINFSNIRVEITHPYSFQFLKKKSLIQKMFSKIMRFIYDDATRNYKKILLPIKNCITFVIFLKELLKYYICRQMLIFCIMIGELYFTQHRASFSSINSSINNFNIASH